MPKPTLDQIITAQIWHYHGPTVIDELGSHAACSFSPACVFVGRMRHFTSLTLKKLLRARHLN